MPRRSQRRPRLRASLVSRHWDALRGCRHTDKLVQKHPNPPPSRSKVMIFLR
jgi:hypothetical protein